MRKVLRKKYEQNKSWYLEEEKEAKENVVKNSSKKKGKK